MISPGVQEKTNAARAIHLNRDGAIGCSSQSVWKADACDACLRRTALIASLAGRIEVEWRSRRKIAGLLALPDKELLKLGGQSKSVTQNYLEFDPVNARSSIESGGIVAICRCSSNYPQQLFSLTDPPAIIHFAGSQAPIQSVISNGTLVSVVGARRATQYGIEMARALSREAVKYGITVVSGMALGIDSASHGGALIGKPSEGDGTTVAVLAGGADIAYPASKRSLYRRIIEVGCVISELPPGFTAFRWCFIARNRIIAALSSTTVVVEAGERSGSLSTADFAIDLGRTVAAVPGNVTSRLSAGTNDLIRQGATVIRNTDDVLELVLGGDLPLKKKDQLSVKEKNLEPRLESLLGAVEEGRGTLAEIATTVEEARAAALGLTELELMGLIQVGFGGRYIRVAI